jgi:alpha-beta hydrolase superfamily lysophospholipase
VVTVRLTPEVVLFSDSLMSKFRWTIQHETERIETLAADNPEVGDLLRNNGWTARMLAWQHVIDGLAKLAQFDDEEGRT